MQSSYKDTLHGLLDISFPLDQVVASNGFQDKEALAAAFARLVLGRDLIRVLATQFDSLGVDAKATAEPKAEGSLPPEMLKMLEKAMSEKKTTTAAAESPDDAPVKKELQAEWEKTHGRMSCVVGKELYEALCFRLGMLDFMYIKSMVDKIVATHGDDMAELPADGPEELTVARLNAAIWQYECMLRAQGPIGSVGDNPSVWKPASSGPHTEETPRLFYHAIYSSHNLRAMKHQAELCYWRWK
jgi:hypothetical protein